MSLEQVFKKINEIYKDLNKFADELKIISRIELKEKIKELLQKHPLTEDEKKIIEEEYELPPLNYIFLGVISKAPDSIYAPSLIERKEYRDIIFYHGHTLGVDDQMMERAMQRVYKFKEERMKSILINFLRMSEFKTETISKKEILATKNKLKISVRIYPSVLILEDKLKEIEIKENCVVAIPTGGNPGPYINFYKVYGNKILLENAYVWIVDIEGESISPLIGHSKDPEINSNFKSSDLARHAQRIIGMEINEDF
ncbi:MAG: DUF6834 family protein [Candidatus Helarchaeota archaeon]